MKQPLSINRAIEQGKISVYVMAEFWEQCESINGYDAICIRYIQPNATTMIYKNNRYVIQSRKYGCGVFTVKCIFVKG